MKLSARNQFQGTVTKITEGQAMAEVTVKVGTLEFNLWRRLRKDRSRAWV